MTTIIKTDTYVLNLRDASSRTYQTWVTLQLRSDGALFRLTNRDGNGQVWAFCGYMNRKEMKLIPGSDWGEWQARIVAHCVKLMGERVNLLGFGAAWRNATVVKPKLRWSATAKRFYRLTAAPSVRDGHPDRDRNVNEMRSKVGGGLGTKAQRQAELQRLIEARERRKH